jgi:hypothetical protein
MSSLRARRSLLCAALGVLLPRAGATREVSGVTLAEAVPLGENAALPLLGAGVFRYFFLTVYACGLYLLPRAQWREGPLGADGPRRVTLVMLRRVSARLFLWGLDKGLADNTPSADLVRLSAPINALRETIRSLDSLDEAARVRIDYLPRTGTRVYLGDRPVSEPIPGKEFNDALLRVWIGPRPLDATLKGALLGS